MALVDDLAWAELLRLQRVLGFSQTLGPTDPPRPGSLLAAVINAEIDRLNKRITATSGVP
jgi:hypothetical protein